MYCTRNMGRLLIMLLASAFILSCAGDSADEKSENPKISKLKLLPDFEVDHLYSPSADENGSWVAMAFDDKGRLITADQYGMLYRLTLSPLGVDSLTRIERLDIGKTSAELNDPSAPQVELGYAQGLLYAFNSLYVMVNNGGGDGGFTFSGLYRLQDTDGDDQFDKVTMLKRLHGGGEHGPHSAILAPDGKSIYVISGNHTDVPPMDAYRLPPVWQEDNLFPLIKDPRGHANNRMAPGGWIARIDSLGQHWELISAGYRNAFDIAFNDDGELFSYDADMEWDFGMPWYRPTRICHATSGSEYGWRTGNSKWAPEWPDNLPAVLDIGQGSPTNLISGREAAFPERYRKALFAFDWSFGIIYAIHLQENGASYSAKAEEFLSGAPLPLTDGVIGPDGALYFLTGGRRLESDLYRVYYNGKDADKMLAQNVSNISTATSELRELRKQLEAFHSGPEQGAVDFAWPHLRHEDRFIQYAARIVLEHNPVAEWQSRALTEKDPVSRTQAIISLARHAKPALGNSLLKSLMEINYNDLNESQQIDLLRAFELVILRQGMPAGELKIGITNYLDSHYPANSNSLNRQLSKLLVHLEAPGAVDKTLALLKDAKDDPTETAQHSSDLILRNPQYGMDIAEMLANVPPAQQSYYVTVLSRAKSGWTSESQEVYFKWFRDAFRFKGGRSYVGFLNKARLYALENVAPDQQEHFRQASGEEFLSKSGNDLISGPQPKGPGRKWKLDEAVAVVEEQLVGRNFEQGKAMFDATRCSSCHQMRGAGSALGPDLTQLGTRFSVKDMLEAIIDPSKVVSDQYAATVFTMKDGSSILGRLSDEDNQNYYISQNPFTPDVLREVAKSDVAEKKYSYISVMYPGLINSLNEEELKDLLAFLMAGGNPDHEIYKNQ